MKLPAGTYFIGDPCYCFDKSWSKVLNETDYYSEPYKTDKGISMAFNTAYGDGLYEDWFGGRYPVDAGLIGATDIRLVERSYKGEKLEKIGRVVEFKEEFEINSKNGILSFGKFKIDTN